MLHVDLSRQSAPAAALRISPSPGIARQQQALQLLLHIASFALVSKTRSKSSAGHDLQKPGTSP